MSRRLVAGFLAEVMVLTVAACTQPESPVAAIVPEPRQSVTAPPSGPPDIADPVVVTRQRPVRGPRPSVVTPPPAFAPTPVTVPAPSPPPLPGGPGWKPVTE